MKFFTDHAVGIKNPYLLIKLQNYLKNNRDWNQWREIFIDPGVYELEFTKDAHKAKDKTIFIEKGEIKRLSVKLDLIEDEIVEPEVKTGKLIVKSEPAAHVWIGGKDTGELTPAEIDLAPGSYDVVLKLDGYYDVKFTAFINAGKEFNVEKILTEVEIPEIKYKVTVTSSPSGARVFVNESLWTYPTPTSIILYPGTYKFRLEAEGFFPLEEVVEL